MSFLNLKLKKLLEVWTLHEIVHTLGKILSVSKGAKCSREGGKYEVKCWNILKNTTLNGNPFNTQIKKELGGSSSKNDILCNFKSEKDIGIEVKTKLEAEFIQLDVCKDNDNKWIAKKNSRQLPQVIDRFITELNKKETESSLFHGNIPCFPYKSREEFDEWEREFIKEKKIQGEKTTKDYRWKITENIVKKNYFDKGNNYIQIGTKGLYHLGEDICNFGVPEFNPKDIELRLRCKRRGSKGCIPNSLTLSAWVKNLEASPYSLDNKDTLSPNLIYNNYIS